MLELENRWKDSQEVHNIFTSSTEIDRGGPDGIGR